MICPTSAIKKNDITHSLSMNAYDANVSPFGFIATIELPGVKKADLSIQFEDRKMLISWKRNNVQFKFHRYFVLGKLYDIESTSATLKNGILTLKVDRFEQPKPSTFMINVK